VLYWTHVAHVSDTWYFFRFIFVSLYTLEFDVSSCPPCCLVHGNSCSHTVIIIFKLERNQPVGWYFSRNLTNIYFSNVKLVTLCNVSKASYLMSMESPSNRSTEWHRMCVYCTYINLSNLVYTKNLSSFLTQNHCLYIEKYTLIVYVTIQFLLLQCWQKL